MSSLPSDLIESVEQLRMKLVEINASEQNRVLDVLTSAARGTPIPEVQAVMARYRQAAATAATTAIDTFRSECSVIGAQANSLTTAAIATATAESVSDFWIKSESYAAASMAEAAALLPAHGPDKTTQAINNTCGDRASAINCYFQQLTT
jgi:predicted nucleic acid-binding protein